jgi:ribosomal-protein-alanine N-acetyltransferase
VSASDANEFLVRLMEGGDVAQVQAIAARVETAPHWPEAEFLRLAETVAARPARRGAWVALAGSDLMIVGFAYAHRLVDEVEVESIVTAPEHRRCGVGALLLTEMIGWTRSVGVRRLLLECRRSNESALRLYSRCGFQQDGVRPKYYCNPEEDAVLMSLLFPQA